MSETITKKRKRKKNPAKSMRGTTSRSNRNRDGSLFVARISHKGCEWAYLARPSLCHMKSKHIIYMKLL
uniref:LD14406p n=1 Tax=Drosophila melanogaster TaxID=7227 RepID=Q95RS3_DROME|nr:LD14406p [Drosophila melanogaster]